MVSAGLGLDSFYPGLLFLFLFLSPSLGSAFFHTARLSIRGINVDPENTGYIIFRAPTLRRTAPFIQSSY